MTTLRDDVFGALASPTRRELLNLLLTGPRTVNDLASHFDMRRPSVSEHLKVLRDAELVTEQKVGRERHYQLEAEPLMKLQHWLHPYEQFWRERMKALGEVLEDM
ncbi:ArsR/SmtB family transcription factor [Phytoactinopolyspora mesophila]|uniref:Metalloregulator ArsR/SmtB family transcription factor n=1 Tax=Phytoactinopolyspora mesophila TaxID=2650750 RepID=A0A7K3MBX1_9ACTN|nr:metalloregulator ArsR/SmtB family transcription factor [Phytoactinopolyspora mesophila]NDL60660.1 metalloregulator ArsR/SmtB family transcription factor [Phytoactinopolyspora mesophila]